MDLLDRLRLVAEACAKAEDPLALTLATDPMLETLPGVARTVAAALVEEAAGRLRSDAALRDLRERVDSAQQLADMGDYDWHIASDTNLWSDQLFRIYGYEPGAIDPSYDRFLAHIHPEDRDRIAAVHRRAYETGEPYQMVERIVRPDGEVRHLSSNGEVVHDEEGTPTRMRGTCIDITDRVLAEEAREESIAAAREAAQRRRQALEINDNVVQGLVAAGYAMEADDALAARSYVDRTLRAARTMMDDLIRRADGDEIEPGHLVRSEAATLGPAEDAAAQDAAAEPDAPDAPPVRVLIVDDSEDLRMVFRMKLDSQPQYDVVGEAADGLEAVDLARELRPDLVLLDLAMPRMDGLQALPLIREAVDGVRVVVLSGFNQSTMTDRALAAGADRYVVKGGSMRELVAVLDEVVSAGSSSAPSAGRPGEPGAAPPRSAAPARPA